MYCRVEDKLSVCIKTTPSCFKKEIKTLLLRLSTFNLPRISESTFPSKISSYNSWKTAQLSKMVRNNVPLTVQPFEHNALSPEVPGAVSSLSLLEAPSLFREYLFFILWFLNHRVFDTFTQFKSCGKSVSRYFYCLMLSLTANRRAWPWQCVKWARDSISFIYVGATVLAPSMSDVPLWH